MHLSFKSVPAVRTSDLPLALSFSFLDTAFISDLLPQQLDDTFPIGYFVEVPVVQKAVRDQQGSFSLRISFLVPFSDIVLVIKLMLHHFVLLEQPTVL